MSTPVAAPAEQPETAPAAMKVIYGIDDVPTPLWRSLLLGLQHVLTAFGATVAVPLILGPAMGFSTAEIGLLVSSVMMASGIATLLQVNFGTRLPLIQGVSFAFLGPFFAIIAVHGNASMPYIAGSILVGSLVEMAIGYLGLIGKLRQLLTPVVIGPVIALIGLTLYDAGANFAGSNWWLSGLVIVSAFVLSLVIGPRNRVVQMFPILLAVIIAYAVAVIGSTTGFFAPGSAGYVDFSPIAEAPWFRSIGVGDGAIIFPWGPPKFVLAFILGTLAGFLASIIESFGDYHTIGLIAAGRHPTEQEINRGIGTEGVGCFITGLVGGFSSTSYTENIGLVGLTGVASRYVVNVAAVLLILLGLFSKFGAAVATIPQPVVGGLFITLFGLIASVGLSALQRADLNSQRNLMIVGFLLFMGLSLPFYLDANPVVFSDDWAWAAQIINTIGTTGMAVAAIFGLLLDNLIPGTPEERGII